VSDSPYDEEMVSNIPQVSYEFPSGYRNDYGVERFKIAETLFDPARCQRFFFLIFLRRRQCGKMS
jgi:hypothetical protein